MPVPAAVGGSEVALCLPPQPLGQFFAVCTAHSRGQMWSVDHYSSLWEAGSTWVSSLSTEVKGATLSGIIDVVSGVGATGVGALEIGSHLLPLLQSSSLVFLFLKISPSESHE